MTVHGGANGLEVECGAGRLEVDLWNPQARAELETGRFEAADPSSRVEPPEEKPPEEELGD